MSKFQAPLVLLVLIGLGGGRVLADEPPAVAKAEAAVDGERAAIEALVVEFVRAFNAGDAPAIAALFTEGARIQADDSPPVEGRAAIEALFAERFEDDPGQTIALKTESLRFLGADAAIEEGSAAITIPAESPGDRDEVSRYKYTAAYVRKDGKWLQDCIHDFVEASADDAKSPRERLAALDWLIGDWMDEDDHAEVHTSCAWADDGAFLTRTFRVKVQGSFVMSGVQRIGWDPRLKQFRSWTFDSEGGFSEGLWSREGDGDRWIVKTTGVLKDGRSASATNVLSREGRDVLRWASVDRTLGAAAYPDVESILLVRKPPAPKAATSSADTKPTEPAGSQP